METKVVEIYTLAEKKPHVNERVFYFVKRVGWCAGYCRIQNKRVWRDDTGMQIEPMELKLMWYDAGEGDNPCPIIEAYEEDIWFYPPIDPISVAFEAWKRKAKGNVEVKVVEVNKVANAIIDAVKLERSIYPMKLMK